MGAPPDDHQGKGDNNAFHECVITLTNGYLLNISGTTKKQLGKGLGFCFLSCLLSLQELIKLLRSIEYAACPSTTDSAIWLLPEPL